MRSEDNLRATIEKDVQRRGIRSVLHFTRAANLMQIGNHGLLSRAELDRRRIPYTPNDCLRLDGALGASCLSIGWPNYQMFFRYRDSVPDEAWIVLEIMPEVLWKMDCSFSWTNAASGLVRGMALTQRASVQAFTEMFVDHRGQPLRCRCHLELSNPTNPQAEVLVFNPIPTEMVTHVHSNRRLPPRALPAAFASKLMLDGAFFGPRPDYAMWRRQKRVAEEGH